jgi:cytochrome c-type biogenesis protein CcmH/NrfF
MSLQEVADGGIEKLQASLLLWKLAVAATTLALLAVTIYYRRRIKEAERVLRRYGLIP